MTQQGWIIRNAFIVLVAERPIDTDMLNPEILRESGITPAQWELVEPTEGRAGTFIAYRNGITISAQNTRCVFQQNFNDETVGDPADGIYDVAKRYVDATRLVQYRHVGINWALYQTVPDPKDWLRAYILNPDNSVERYRNIEIKMTAPFGSSLCNLTFTARADEVGLAFNYHFNLNQIALNEAIDQWSKCDHDRRGVLAEHFGRSL